MSVIVFIICFISCIVSMIGYLRRKYKQRSRFMHGYYEHDPNSYNKLSFSGVHILLIRGVHILSPYDVYKLFVGQNKNSDYQQREHDYHWYRFDRYELTSSKKYIFTNIVLCIAMAVMIIHYTFLVMDGVAILEGGYQYIPLLISVAICTNKLINEYKAYKIAKVIENIYDNMLPQIIEGKRINLSFKYLGEYVTLAFKFVIFPDGIHMIDERPYKRGEIDVFVAINNNETRTGIYIYKETNDE